MRNIFGRILSVDISEVKGVSFGTVLLEGVDGERHELRYTTESQGEIPAIHEYGEVSFDGNRIVDIFRVQTPIGDERFSKLDSQKKSRSDSSRLWFALAGYYMITGVMYLVGVFIEGGPVPFLIPGGAFVFSGILVLFPRLRFNDPYDYIPSAAKRIRGAVVAMFSCLMFMWMIAYFLWNPEDLNTLFMSIGGFLTLAGFVLSVIVIMSVSCSGGGWN